MASLLKAIEKKTWAPLKRAIRRFADSGTPIRLIAPNDYESYRRSQTNGNRRKLTLVAAHEANIRYLADYAATRVGSSPRVLCHGTRNGAEQRWFKQNLPDATVLGTDIADTAQEFPDTIQWDFHETKPEWIGAWDVIYSNSWDHAFDPDRAFRGWMACLSPRGIMLLEHCNNHLPAHASALDPFGATLPALRDMLDRIGGGRWKVIETLDTLPVRAGRLRVVVVGRADQPARSLTAR